MCNPRHLIIIFIYQETRAIFEQLLQHVKMHCLSSPPPQTSFNVERPKVHVAENSEGRRKACHEQDTVLNYNLSRILVQ